MALSGTRKAALLLMSLDPETAAELLRSVDADDVAQIAAEVSFLESTPDADAPGEQTPMEEFCTLLQSRGSDDGGLAQRIVEGAVGAGQSAALLSRVEDMVRARDPFRTIRSAAARKIASALRGEPPQVAAMVLAELAPAKSGELLGLLAEEVRTNAVCGMATGGRVSPEARLRVATAVEARMRDSEKPEAEAAPEAEPEEEDIGRQAQLRKVAVLLRGLSADFREELTNGINAEDEETGKEVMRQMVLWEDLVLLPERSLQDALRTVDARNLAMSLVNADEATVARIRDNISERASTMLDEEVSLLSDPKEEEISAARDAILESLRELNSGGNLTFEEPE